MSCGFCKKEVDKFDDRPCGFCKKPFKKCERACYVDMLEADKMYRWKERAHLKCYMKPISGWGKVIEPDSFLIEKDEFLSDEKEMYNILRDVWK